MFDKALKLKLSGSYLSHRSAAEPTPTRQFVGAVCAVFFVQPSQRRGNLEKHCCFAGSAARDPTFHSLLSDLSDENFTPKLASRTFSSYFIFITIPVGRLFLYYRLDAL